MANVEEMTVKFNQEEDVLRNLICFMHSSLKFYMYKYMCIHSVEAIFPRKRKKKHFPEEKIHPKKNSKSKWFLFFFFLFLFSFFLFCHRLPLLLRLLLSFFFPPALSLLLLSSPLHQALHSRQNQIASTEKKEFRLTMFQTQRKVLSVFLSLFLSVLLLPPLPPIPSSLPFSLSLLSVQILRVKSFFF